MLLNEDQAKDLVKAYEGLTVLKLKLAKLKSGRVSMATLSLSIVEGDSDFGGQQVVLIEQKQALSLAVGVVEGQIAATERKIRGLGGVLP